MALLAQGERESASSSDIDLGSGVAQVEIRLPRRMFFETLSQQSGLQVGDDGDLMQLIGELAEAKREYDKVALSAEGGAGDRLRHCDARRGGAESGGSGDRAAGGTVRRADARQRAVHTPDPGGYRDNGFPIVGNEKQSEDMVNYLLQEFEGDTGKLWQSNIFGRSFHEIVGEDLQAKLKRMLSGCAGKAAAGAGAHHQRGRRRTDLHHSVTPAEPSISTRPDDRPTLCCLAYDM